MRTKHEEVIKTTSDLSEMKDLYLAERLYKGWEEDFVDEDTGQVVTIQRKEMLYEKGTLLDMNTLSELNFHLQAGDFTEVKVSNIKRSCILHHQSTNLWSVTVDLNGKNKTIYLYANSAVLAVEIASDYIEQAFAGHYGFKTVKAMNYFNLVIDKSDEEDEEDEDDENAIDVYQITLEITENDFSYNNSFVLKASDAENAKQKIGLYMANERMKVEKSLDFDIKIISAKTIPCNSIINPTFSRVYLDDEEVK